MRQPALCGSWDTVRQKRGGWSASTSESFQRELCVYPLLVGPICFTDTMAIDHSGWLDIIDSEERSLFVRTLAGKGLLKLALRGSASNLDEVLAGQVCRPGLMLFSSLPDEQQKEAARVVASQRTNEAKLRAFFAATSGRRFKDQIKWLQEVFGAASIIPWQTDSASFRDRVRKVLGSFRASNIESYHRESGGPALLSALQGMLEEGGGAEQFRTDWYARIDRCLSDGLCNQAAADDFKCLIDTAYLANWAEPKKMDIISSEQASVGRSVEAADTELGRQIFSPSFVTRVLADGKASAELFARQEAIANARKTLQDMGAPLSGLMQFLLGQIAQAMPETVFDPKKYATEIKRVATVIGTGLGFLAAHYAVGFGVGPIVVGAGIGYAAGEKAGGLLFDEQLIAVSRWLFGDRVAYTQQAAEFFDAGTARPGEADD